MIIASQTGGRLANQLYFVLQAACMSNRLGIAYKYIQTNSIAKQTDLRQYVDLLGIQQYYSINGKPDLYLQLNKYYQYIDEDFSYSELSLFIQTTILQSDFFKQPSHEINIDNTAAIHIRNGDYLQLKMHNCFDRISYMKRAILMLPNCIQQLHIYSDDNMMNKHLYDEIFKSQGFKVEYFSDDPITDLKNLSFYKYKILWNSTFSYWSAFIADERYNNCLTIYPELFTENEKANTRCKKEWKLCQ